MRPAIYNRRLVYPEEAISSACASNSVNDFHTIEAIESIEIDKGYRDHIRGLNDLGEVRTVGGGSNVVRWDCVCEGGNVGCKDGGEAIGSHY